MRPYPEEVQRAIQSVLVAHFAPELRSPYSQRELGIVMLLFSIIQRDTEGAVPDLLEANAELRLLLRDAAAALQSVDATAAASARQALGALPPVSDSLRLSALRAENDALRSALVALTPVIEPAADDPALRALAPVRDRIYDHLARDAKKRVVPMLGG